MPEQFAGVSMMVWLACVYALGLVAVGWGFDILAKRTSQRFVASRTFGFTYHESNDAWLCPEDQWLWPVAFDTDNRVMRYRAKPSVCNTCPIKDTCTVSSNGRELTREVDEWPYSESGKFHRGLAVAVALFGPVIMVAAAFGWHSPIELLIELAAVVVCLSLTYPLAIKPSAHPRISQPTRSIFRVQARTNRLLQRLTGSLRSGAAWAMSANAAPMTPVNR